MKPGRYRRHMEGLAGRPVATDAPGIIEWMGVEKGFYWCVIFRSAKDGTTENVYSHDTDPTGALERRLRAGMAPISYFRFHPYDPATAEIAVLPPFANTDVIKSALRSCAENARRYLEAALSATVGTSTRDEAHKATS